VFLLDFCMKDIPPVAISALHGLNLLPTEDPSFIGRIGDATDAPIYLASEFERRLLQRVGKVRWHCCLSYPHETSFL
jgi:hypothetical protein